MAIVAGWGTAIALTLGIIDRFIPSRKAAVIKTLGDLETQYHYALINKQDTEASVLRKKMAVLRKRIEIGGIDET